MSTLPLEYDIAQRGSVRPLNIGNDLSQRATGWISAFFTPGWTAQVTTAEAENRIPQASIKGLEKEEPPQEWKNRTTVTFKPRTPLGKRLWEIRKRIVASGQPLLTMDEIEEIMERNRGSMETGN